MARFAKTLKKYERHFLLALVILLLLTFSVGGAVQCQNESGPGGVDYGGTFLVDPNAREALDNNEFVSWLRRLDPYRQTVRVPSLRYEGILRRAPADARMRAAWSHILPTEAARAAGYACGEEFQLQAAVRRAVDTVMRGMQFNDATYDQYIREYYRRPAKDFEKTIAEVVMKDAFLQPLIETRRFETSYEQAYVIWKNLLERVDLEYVALKGADFSRPALERERTRDRIGAQANLLNNVSRTARDLDILDTRVKSWLAAHDGAAPESIEEVADFSRKDAWDKEFRYTKTTDGYDLRSAGPDASFESSDDVIPATVSQLKTRAALREVGAALLRWREATEAWPETLDALREAPAEGALAPLTGSANDAWDAQLVYESGDRPRLFSKGPDGEAGTDDDVAAVIDGDTVAVPAGREFVAYLLDEDKDIWERPLRIDLAHALTWQWTVSSAGRDGEFGSDDDLDTGNHRELENFYQRPDVKVEFEVPEKKDFEAAYVHLPLIPDASLAWLLEAYPQHRPDEEDAYDRWRQLHQYSYYMAEDPADPETGHGAEHARAVAPGVSATLIPASTVFGEAPEGFVGEDDPDRKIYLEKGWRPILLREQFLEHVMNDLLTRARESQQAVAEWEAKKTSFDAGEGEDPGERPTAVTFQGLLDGELADFRPKAGDAPWIGTLRTEKPLERTDIESLPNLGDINLTMALQQLKEDGAYAATPTIVNDSHTKVIVHLLENHARHDRPLAEVRDPIFDRFVESKCLDLAEKALEDLRTGVADAQRDAEGPPDGEGAIDRDEIWTKTVEAWRESLGIPSVLEKTGPFIGAKPPLAQESSEAEGEAETARRLRREFARARGYDALRAGVKAEEGLRAGVLAASILRDDLVDGSDSVFLFRLADVSVPPRVAFSPRAYADYLSSEIVGGPKGGRRLGASSGGEQLDGSLIDGLRHYYFDFPWLRSKFSLDTEFNAEADAAE